MRTATPVRGPDHVVDLISSEASKNNSDKAIDPAATDVVDLTSPDQKVAARGAGAAATVAEVNAGNAAEVVDAPQGVPPVALFQEARHQAQETDNNMGAPDPVAAAVNENRKGQQQHEQQGEQHRNDLHPRRPRGNGSQHQNRKRQRPERASPRWLMQFGVIGKTDPNVRNAENGGADLSMYPPNLAAVLSVVPEVDVDYAKRLLEDHKKFDDDVARVIAKLLDDPNGYPKDKDKVEANKKAAKAAAAALSGTVSGSTTKWKFDYMLQSSFEPSPQYREEAREQLAYDFPFLKGSGAKRILAKFGGHYAIAHDKILTAVKGNTLPRAAAAAISGGGGMGQDLEIVQYRRVEAALKGRKLDKAQTRAVNRIVVFAATLDKTPSSPCTMKKPRSTTGEVPVNPTITDVILQDEVQFVREKLGDWQNDVRKRMQRQVNKQKAKLAGTAEECSCCFDEYDIRDMVNCTSEKELHLFCVDCVRGYAESQLFGNGNLGIDKETKKPALELMCCYGGDDGCTSRFDRSALEKALTAKALQKYDEVQCQLSVEQAGLNSEICSCPKCGFQAAVPETMRVFHCPVADCQFESCRQCGEEAHVPLRCDEVEKKEELEGRLTVEEAITKAKIRKCPKCSKPFIKSDGCNKIRCGCGANVCYVCRKQINNDYQHFCQKPHCDHKSCKLCALYTNSDEDDARAMKEAGIKAAAKQTVQVDVESILKDPAMERKTPKRRRLEA